MSTIIGCGSESTGRFIRCVDCPYMDDPESCLTWRRDNDAETTVEPADEGFPKLFPERKVKTDEYNPFCNKKIIGSEIMEHIRQVELAFRKDKLLKLIQMETYKFIPRVLSKKLYERCVKNCHPDTMQAHRKRMNHILSERYQLSWATYVQFDKYTVVEIVYNCKHYHGLSVCAPCDVKNTSAGIAYAYRRAFESMMEDTLWH